jgi:hypothetical protein
VQAATARATTTERAQLGRVRGAVDPAELVQRRHTSGEGERRKGSKPFCQPARATGRQQRQEPFERGAGLLAEFGFYDEAGVE